MSEFVALISVMVLGWAVGIEPRLQLLKKADEDLKELIQVQLANIDKRLGRIENSLNGHLRRD